MAKNESEDAQKKVLEEALHYGLTPEQISDGYHTFDELYLHRIALWIRLCAVCASETNDFVWRSRLHSDGTCYESWFILGIHSEPGKQVTYHVPLYEWNNTNFAETLKHAPEFDGHTSADVLLRLRNI